MATIVTRLRTPSPWFLGLGGLFNLPDGFYYNEIKMTGSANFAEELDKLITNYQQHHSLFVFGDLHQLDVTIDLLKSEKDPVHVSDYIRETYKKHPFIAKATITVTGTASTITILNSNVQKNRQVFSYFPRHFLTGALFSVMGMMLASWGMTGALFPLAALLKAGWYGGWINAGFGYFRRAYLNYAGHFFDTKEKIQQIKNNSQQQALDYGAQATSWKNYILSYSPTRYQTYLYPMTFSAGRENKALVEEVNAKKLKI